MPYITDKQRRGIDNGWTPNDPGELTYAIQQVLAEYLDHRGLKYARLAECLGALEGTKLDLIERVVTPYEERKRAENGDVWPKALTDEVRLSDKIGGLMPKPGEFLSESPGPNVARRAAGLPIEEQLVEVGFDRARVEEIFGAPMPDFIGDLARRLAAEAAVDLEDSPPRPLSDQQESAIRRGAGGPLMPDSHMGD